MFDCLRANKSTMAWGLEARVPFLDRDFLELMMSFDAEQKMCVDAQGKKRIEKWILRAAFDTEMEKKVLQGPRSEIRPRLCGNRDLYPGGGGDQRPQKKSPRREVLRSSAGADAIRPPFLGVIRVAYPKACYGMSSPL